MRSVLGLFCSIYLDKPHMITLLYWPSMWVKDITLIHNHNSPHVSNAYSVPGTVLSAMHVCKCIYTYTLTIFTIIYIFTHFIYIHSFHIYINSFHISCSQHLYDQKLLLSMFCRWIMRHKNVKWLGPSPTARKQRTWDLNLGSLDLESLLLITMLYFLWPWDGERHLFWE